MFCQPRPTRSATHLGLLALPIMLASFPSIARAAGYDRPSGDPHASRSATIAQHGMVATSHPLATLAGLDVLRAGGNAADAAIAANAMLGLVEPMSCGIGGDLFVLYWDAKTAKLYGLNASGRSPYALNRDLLAQRKIRALPTHGPLSWSVPGCVDGWQKLHERFGRHAWPKLLEAAIHYADDGFPVSELIGDDWQAAAAGLARSPDSAATYLIDGRAPRVGERFRNPRLAESYRRIAAGGAAAFYRGEIAAEIVRFSSTHGGFFTQRDFDDHTSDWVEPVSTNYRGYDVWELPPNGQGIAVLEMLNLLEGYDLKSLGPASAEYLHLLIEAKKLAFADRARWYADPAFEQLPVAELISKPYAERQRGRMDRARAAVDVPPGDPRLAGGDTIYLCAVDAERNCCSLIQSNFFGFGSLLVPGNVGFVLQNRGALFALDPAHPNCLEPHKRPFHTIIPGFVTHQGRPWMAFGVMGGDMQPQGHVQVLVNQIDFGMTVQEAGDAARVRHFGSAEPTGKPADAAGGSVVVESGITDEVLAALVAKGHRVHRGKGDFGGYQAIRVDHDLGVLHGASEPRKDGCALGY